MNQNNLIRFIDAQKASYATALSEIKKGKKQSHWMWFIFPQIEGLGHSSMAKFYGIKDLNEASEYLKHEVLGQRLIEICETLLTLQTSDPYEVFGTPDDLKLKSSMTLFSQIEDPNPVFKKVLEKFFDGEEDRQTLRKLGG